jgi:tetratricopeptide (TPR) repeat protein
MRLSALGYVVRVAAPSDEVAASMAFVDNPLATAPFVSRLLTALRVAAGAAGLLVFPAGLSADYSYDAVRVSTGLDGAEEAGALLAAALFAAALPLSARRSPAASAALAWAGLTYLPGSNLVLPSGTIFGERLLYVPLAGFAILAAEAARWAAGSGRLRRAAVAALAAAVVLILAARFWSRASDWSSDEALFRSAAAVHPGSVKARHNLGFALERAGRLEEAAAEYRAALRIAPWLVRTRMNLADCLAGSGKVEEAVAELEIAVESHPEVPYLSAALARAHYTLGVRRHEEGRQDAFLSEMEAAVRYDPLHGPARYNLAVDALRRGDREAARLHAEAAIRAGYDLPPGFREAAGLAPPSP